MPTDIDQSRQYDSVIQFSALTPNRLGHSHDLAKALGVQGAHVLALTVLDTNNSAIIQFVVDDPDKVQEVLHNQDSASSPESSNKRGKLRETDQALTRPPPRSPPI